VVSPFPAQIYLLCPRYTVGAFFERWVRTGTAMPSTGKQQHIRRERRRLGRFVAFAEMEADLSSVPLFDKPPASEPNAIGNRSDRKSNN
jgi:hypothetical protein